MFCLVNLSIYIVFIYRLTKLLGFEATDFIGHVPFEFHHHDDVNTSLECAKESK